MGWNELIGSRLGKYEIIGEIARGGMSRVYRAREIGADREAAVKVMALGGDSADGSDQRSFTRRFEHEAHAVQRLDHPNIVKVFDADKNDEFVYIAMQLVLGGTFRTRLGKPLPIDEACNYAMQMARALHHAHMHEVIHRDVKPANMLVDEQDPSHLLLADFGIAKIMGQKGVTKTGTAVGTPEYMAPEQAKGEEIDPRADIYGLACVLYESLAGRPPFVGPTALSICYQHVHTRPAYIRGFNPEVPRALALIIEQALAKNPRDRFPSAEAFAVALYPFTEPSGSYVRRSVLAPTPGLDLDLRGTPDETDITPDEEAMLSNVAPPPLLIDNAAPAFAAASPMLDLSAIHTHASEVATPIEDDTTRQTQEMAPVAPSRPRHTRPGQPGLRLKSRPITVSDRPSYHTPRYDDPAGLSTIQTPTPPPMTPGYGNPREPEPRRNRLIAMIIAAMIIALIAALILTQVHRGPGASIARNPTATTVPTIAPTLTPLVTITTTGTPEVTPTLTVAQQAIAGTTSTTAIDRSCNSTRNTTSFASGEVIYINVCIANGFGQGEIKAIYYHDGEALKATPTYSQAMGGQGFDLHIDGTLASGNYRVDVLWNNGVGRSLFFTIN